MHPLDKLVGVKALIAVLQGRHRACAFIIHICDAREGWRRRSFQTYVIVIGENAPDLVLAELQPDRFSAKRETFDVKQASVVVIDALEESAKARLEHVFSS